MENPKIMKQGIMNLKYIYEKIVLSSENPAAFTRGREMVHQNCFDYELVR